jgi:hypothetical protein
MHADPAGKWGRLLSPRFLLDGCERVPALGEGCVPCLACHRTDGPAPLGEVFTHPRVTFTNVVPPDAPGYMPLFNAAGAEDAQGQVVCRTCHLAHGWAPDGAHAGNLAGLTEEQKRAMRYQLRPFTPPNLCTSCHGLDGLQRFLYFHDPARRGE